MATCSQPHQIAPTGLNSPPSPGLALAHEPLSGRPSGTPHASQIALDIAKCAAQRTPANPKPPLKGARTVKIFDFATVLGDDTPGHSTTHQTFPACRSNSAERTGWRQRIHKSCLDNHLTFDPGNLLTAPHQTAPTGLEKTIATRGSRWHTSPCPVVPPGLLMLVKSL